MTLHDLYLIEDALRMTCRACGHVEVVVSPTRSKVDRHVRTHRCRAAA